MNIPQIAPRRSGARVSAESAWPLLGVDGRPFHERAARRIEARSAETRSRLGPIGRKPGPKDAPDTLSEQPGFFARLFGTGK